MRVAVHPLSLIRRATPLQRYCHRHRSCRRRRCCSRCRCRSPRSLSAPSASRPASIAVHNLLFRAHNRPFSSHSCSTYLVSKSSASDACKWCRMPAGCSTTALRQHLTGQTPDSPTSSPPVCLPPSPPFSSSLSSAALCRRHELPFPGVVPSGAPLHRLRHVRGRQAHTARHPCPAWHGDDGQAN